MLTHRQLQRVFFRMPDIKDRRCVRIPRQYTRMYTYTFGKAICVFKNGGNSTSSMHTKMRSDHMHNPVSNGTKNQSFLRSKTADRSFQGKYKSHKVQPGCLVTLLQSIMLDVSRVPLSCGVQNLVYIHCGRSSYVIITQTSDFPFGLPA